MMWKSSHESSWVLCFKYFNTESIQNSHNLSSLSSTCSVALLWSLTANAVNTVALVVLPSAVSARPVRPCSWNVLFSFCTWIIVYSPRPLNVYCRPSRDWIWGSPNVQAVKKKRSTCTSFWLVFGVIPLALQSMILWSYKGSRISTTSEKG